MKFITKKAPIVRNSERTYKRSINLHFALIIVAIAAVILKAYTAVPEFLEGEATYTALDQSFKVFLMLAVGAFVAWKYKYPFLIMPIAVTLWYLSMDITAMISGEDFTWELRKLVSMYFGLLMIGLAFWVDVRARKKADDKDNLFCFLC